MIDYRRQFQPTTPLSASMQHILNQIPSEKLWLDLGCGSGGQLAHLTRAVGLDVSFSNLSYCKPINQPLACSDIETTLPFNKGSFDVVMISHVLEHVRSPLELCIEAYRILKTGGILIIGLPIEISLFRVIAHDHYFYGHPGHIYAFSPTGLKRLVELAGFQVDKLEFDIPLARKPKFNSLQTIGNKLVPEWLLAMTCANQWILAKKI